MTYSIVARDPDTGDLGVAVQSHFLAVGSLVSWAEPGAGVVATQSVVEPAFGRRGLELMRSGVSGPEAMRRMLSDDPQQAYRQVAMIDRFGRTAVHTGARCIEVASHRVGDQLSTQANMMRDDHVPREMADAYGHADGDLANRLMSALEAGEAAGGDLRGSQSAALLVVAARPSDSPLADHLCDLRVDDHGDPVGELRRLLELKRAYNRVDLADEMAAAGDMALALEHYEAAHAAQPDNAELAFWHGVALAGSGREDDARDKLAEAFRAGDGWRELLQRLPAAGLLPDDPGLLERLSG